MSVESNQELLICRIPFVITEADPTKNWINCGTSESRLQEAIDKKLVIYAYKGIIVKVSGTNPIDRMGYVVGLCFRPVTNGKYTFNPGFWYHPKSWEEFQRAFNEGKQSCSTNMQWIRTRPMYQEWSGLINKASYYAEAHSLI